MIILTKYDETRAGSPAGPFNARIIEIVDGDPANDRVFFESGFFRDYFQAYDFAFSRLESIRRRVERNENYFRKPID